MSTDDTVGVAQLRQNLSVYLRRVEKGERLVVTDRNRPVAELGPPPTTSRRLDELIAEGRVRPPKRSLQSLPPPLKLDVEPGLLMRALEEDRDQR